MRRTLLTLLLLLSPFSWAAGTIQEQTFVIHYSAVNTGILAEDIARKFGIVQRKSHAIILISPRKKLSEGQADSSVSAIASGHVRRLTGQRQVLAWREIQVDNQFDLIAEFEIQDGEKLDFDISVKPDGAARPISIRFLQQFYRDE